MFLLRWALLFLVIALIAAVFGFGGVAEGATDIARVLFFIFVAVFVVLLITLAPWLLLALVGWLGWRRFGRRWMRRDEKSSAASVEVDEERA